MHGKRWNRKKGDVSLNASECGHCTILEAPLTGMAWSTDIAPGTVISGKTEGAQLVDDLINDLIFGGNWKVDFGSGIRSIRCRDV